MGVLHTAGESGILMLSAGCGKRHAGSARHPFQQGWAVALGILQLRRGGLDGRHLAADDAVDFGLAFVDFVSAGDEEFAEILAAEAHVVRLLRRGDDEVHPPSLVAHLDAQRRGDVETTFGVHAEARPTCVAVIAFLKFEILSAVSKMSVGLDLE